MSRPKGAKNKRPYPETKHKNFYWKVIDARWSAELAAFKRMHNRVRDGKSPSIQWQRTLEGFVLFLKEIGPIPFDLEKPSVGRIRHSQGYEAGNVMWEEHRENSIKRKGTRYES